MTPDGPLGWVEFDGRSITFESSVVELSLAAYLDPRTYVAAHGPGPLHEILTVTLPASTGGAMWGAPAPVEAGEGGYNEAYATEDEDEDEDDIVAQILKGGQPRMPHYIFAHRVLPAVVEQDGPRLSEMLRRDPRAVAEQLWTHAAAMAPDAAPIPFEGFACRWLAAPRWSVFVMTLPPAIAPTEASHVAVAVTPADGPPQEIRYFLLERGGSAGRAVQWLLCQWQSGRHINHDQSPSDVDGFVRRVAEKLGVGGFTVRGLQGVVPPPAAPTARRS